MSKQFLRLTVDIMFDPEDRDEAVETLMDYAREMQEELPMYIGDISVVSSQMKSISLQEVGPVWDLMEPDYFCEDHAHLAPTKQAADAGITEEPTDELTDDLT